MPFWREHKFFQQNYLNVLGTEETISSQLTNVPVCKQPAVFLFQAVTICSKIYKKMLNLLFSYPERHLYSSGSRIIRSKHALNVLFGLAITGPRFLKEANMTSLYNKNYTLYCKGKHENVISSSSNRPDATIRINNYTTPWSFINKAVKNSTVNYWFIISSVQHLFIIIYLIQHFK